ncbi:MAG: hypothetical protein MUE82_06440 [Chloroflexi bacterium]|nr:hypothetical protein [Chloroflexota bacterium]
MTGAADAPLAAAIDVGANSTHLLVARIAASVEPLADESVLLGLGASVYASEVIPRDTAEAVVEALTTYVARARSLGVDEPLLLGTEPFRIAGNAARVVDRICREVGLPFHVLRHDEEGLLTLLGATGGAPLDAEIVIVDIGGGSSELVAAGPGRRPVMLGLPLGSARASAHHVEHDPPTPGELDAIRAEAARVLDGAPDASPARVVLVGGTATNLLKVGDPVPDDDELTRARLARALAELLLEPAAAVAEQHAIRVQRARILGAGAAIVQAILDRYGMDSAVATDEGIRQGAAIASARAGRAWRDVLPRLVGVEGL